RAFTLDSALRDRARRPTLDTRTYRSGLDLARPLPPDWSFAESQKRAPAKTAGLAAILLAAYALARALGTTKSGRGLAETWLPRADKATAKLKLPSFLRHPALAIAATFAVLLYPLARDPGGGRVAALAGALALVLLVLVVLRARNVAARRAESPAKQ